MPEEVLGFDVVVVGSGIAGLTMALEIARAGKDVAVVTKKRLEDSSTNWAQGGIAGVLDSSNQAAIERHIDDTISAGAGVCDEELVRDVISEAAVRIRALIEEGVPFERKSDGEYDLAKEGGHQEKRILHVKDRTGEAIETTLIERLKQQNVTILEQWMAIDLVMRKRGQPQDGSTWNLVPRCRR
ncbi:MAG: FAD-dependent oxidoreductase [Candidatus Thalassarchaeaceae archaeon]